MIPIMSRNKVFMEDLYVSPNFCVLLRNLELSYNICIDIKNSI